MEILPMSAISAPGKYLVITEVRGPGFERGAKKTYYGAALRLPDDLTAEAQDELDRSIVALERAELLPAGKDDGVECSGRFLYDVRRHGGIASMNVEVTSFFRSNVVLSGFQCMAQQWAEFARGLLDEYEAEFHKTQPKFVEQ